jgi:hypothetical protein
MGSILYIRKSLVASFALSIRKPVNFPLFDDFIEHISSTSEESPLYLRAICIEKFNLQKRLAFCCGSQRGFQGHSRFDAPVLHERVKRFNRSVDFFLL